MSDTAIVPPLNGVRVLDVTQSVAGPFCTKLLAQLGADVIKLEPPQGDPGRSLKPFKHDLPHPERSGAFLYLNTGKRSAILDLNDASGRDRLLSLVEQADVLVESFAPRMLPSLGLDFAALRARNPRLVLTSITGFGQSGPYRDYKSADIVAFAMGGLMNTIGFPEDPPLKFGGYPALYMAGFAGFTGTLAALYHAEATGEGQHVDVSVQEAVASSHFQALSQYDYLGTVFRRNYAMMVFPCADGYVGCAIQAHHWQRFVDLLGIPELAGLGSGSVVQRQQNADLIETLILPWMLERTKAEIYRAGQEAGLPFSYFANVQDLFESPQYQARDFFVTIDHPEVGAVRYAGVPYKMSGVPRVEERAPLLGEHQADLTPRPPSLAGKGESGRAAAERAASGNVERDTGEPRESGAPFPAREGGAVNEANRVRSHLPLTGIRILDLGMFQSAPYCGRLLGDLGAEVIKVESGRRPDPLRVQGRGLFPGGDPGEHPWNRSGMINDRNRNKLGLTLDLTTEAGRQCFRELAMISDVVIENFSSRVMAKFGLDYPTLSAVNPGIIMMSIGSQGRTGPERNYVSYGTTLEQTGGLISISGFPDKAPGFSGVAYPDSLAGVFCAGLVIAALRQRTITGQGTHIDLSQREVTTNIIGEAVMEYTLNGRVPGPDGNRDRNWAPQGAYRSAGEDRWVAIAATDDAEWQALCAAIGRPELAGDPRFTTAQTRRQHHDLLDEIITAWTSARDHYAAMHELQAAGVPAGPVLAIDELFADPHLAARGYWEEVEDTEAGRHRYPSRPWKMSGTPLSSRLPAPLFGEHSEQILREQLGIAEATIAAMREHGVIATSPLSLVEGD
jgi:crotonobetainyl-CoA:carnitine CoA-transferase CaiB-like acyl-CoA transferase